MHNFPYYSLYSTSSACPHCWEICRKAIIILYGNVCCDVIFPGFHLINEPSNINTNIHGNHNLKMLGPIQTFIETV